jgi:hypothetical protein
MHGGMTGTPPYKSSGLHDRPVCMFGGLFVCMCVLEAADQHVDSMGWNSIHNEGLSCLAETLECNSSLTELLLENNDFEEPGVSRLALALTRNATLTRCTVYCNPMTDVGACALAAMLTTNTALRTFNMDDW